jgi:hydroxymethylpyrimidine pyrophosphatase-like HAD family hydrolase
MLQLLVCDLDGTLLMRGKPFASADLHALHSLSARGVVRAIATGRALTTARKAIPLDFPIDYLIFSSGAGIMDWHSQALLVTHALQPHDTEQAVRAFMALELDFMLHAPIPDQHLFQFHRTGKPNADFERRLERYAPDGRAFRHGDACQPASQLLAVSPLADPDEPFATVARELPHLSVIRATSPLDGKSMWIEVFAPAVSKSQAAAWLAQARGIGAEHTAAIGNDYNDWDLLRWAKHAAVMADAPATMCNEFTSTSSVGEWLKQLA